MENIETIGAVSYLKVMLETLSVAKLESWSSETCFALRTSSAIPDMFGSYVLGLMS